MANEKRLTEKHYNGEGYYMKCSGLCHFEGHCGNCDELEKLVDRLGEYEDKAEQTVEVVHSGWILNDDGSGTCKHCHNTTKDCWDYDHWMNCCPNCGADMRGDGNG